MMCISYIKSFNKGSMSDISIIFEFQPKKITFRVPTSQTNPLHFNLLYNNKKLSNTEALQIPQGNKQFDLSHLPCLYFDTKNEINKNSIMIYVLYGQKNPAKKIILKRSEMMEKYDIEKKNHFRFQQDFGAFSILYEVSLKNNLCDAQEFVKQIEILQSNVQKQVNKTEESSAKNFQRPSLLQVGNKAERIRRSNYENKQQFKRSMLPNNEPILNLNQKSPQTLTQLRSNLTFWKEEERNEDLRKQDLKTNLFETFNPKYQQQQTNNELNLKNKNQPQKQVHSNHQSKKNISQNDKHQPTHSSHHQSHNPNQYGQNEHHSHEHGHHHSHPLSFKLKTVIIMLIVGFLFLIYDAFDDRFSRKIAKKQSIFHTDSHPEGNKKKKTVKKQKKTLIN